jgi:hypothetical protein
MGAEATCTARFNGKSGTGKARLETDVLQFRGGDVRLTIPFGQIAKISARAGTLRVTFPDGAASFDLGPAASKWAEKIQHPPSRLDKIGVKPEWRVSAVGVDEAAFLEELKRAVAELSIGGFISDNDAIFFGATKVSDLPRLATLKTLMKPNGALWVIRPKGRPEISETAVLAAGSAAGLVDVKVVRFSSTHTAEKFVIPLSKRGPAHE